MLKVETRLRWEWGVWGVGFLLVLGHEGAYGFVISLGPIHVEVEFT